MTQNTTSPFAPLVAAGFPAVEPGAPFVVAGDLALGLLQGAAQGLPHPWAVLAYHAEHLDEPPAEGPRQWRCLIVDSVEARTARINGADLMQSVLESVTDHARASKLPNA